MRVVHKEGRCSVIHKQRKKGKKAGRKGEIIQLYDYDMVNLIILLFHLCLPPEDRESIVCKT